MMCPVRCFSCGKVVADKYYELKERIDKLQGVHKEGDVGKILDELGFDRYCCRRMFISHVEVSEKIIKYDKM